MSFPTLSAQFMPGAGPFDIPGDFYLLLTGAGQASTPDHANFAITDLHFRMELTLDAVPPAETTTLAHQYTDVGNQRGWLFAILNQGQLAVQWSTDGTLANTTVRIASISLPVGTGRIAIGVKLDVNNGAGGNTVTFETAPSLGGSWTDLASETQAGTSAIFNSNQPLVLRTATTAGTVSGRIHKAELRASIAGAVVANPNFTIQTPGTTSFADTAPTPKTWTVTAPATVAGFDWENLPSVFTANWDLGRSNELQPFAPAPGELVLANEDRQLDPEHTGGPWFGELLPRVPVRLRSTFSAVTRDHYYGFVQGGWEQLYQPPSEARCRLKLIDLLDVLDGSILPRDAYELEVRADHPSAYWRLDENDGTQMADSSGNDRHGSYDNGEHVEPLVVGGGRGFNAPHVGDNRGRFVGEGLPVGPPCTLEAWIKTPRDLAAIKTIIAAQRDSALGVALWLQIQTSAGGSPNGELVINFFGLGTFYKARGHTRIDDDEPHHVVCTIAGATAADVKLYVDGVLQTKTTISGTNPGSWPGLLWWNVANTADTTSGDWGLDGVIDEVAVYGVALTADRVAAHYEAGLNAFDGERTDERINRVLDFIGIPASLRDIGVGDTTIGPANYNGRSAGTYIDAVVQSEQGVFYVAHHDGGKLKFRGRYARFTETRSTTSQATWTDDPAGTLHYERDGLEVDPNGIASMVNQVDVTWRGGTLTVADEASVARYGPQTRSLTTDAPTPSSASSAGAWLTSRYGQPQARVRSFKAMPAADNQQWVAVLSAQISDRETVRRHPQQVGSAITQELITEQIGHKVGPGVRWAVDYGFSNADETQVWIWGTSAWGETTAWG